MVGWTDGHTGCLGTMRPPSIMPGARLALWHSAPQGRALRVGKTQQGGHLGPCPFPGAVWGGCGGRYAECPEGHRAGHQEQSCRGRGGGGPPGHEAETRNLVPGPCLGRREIIQGKFRVPGSSRERNPGPGGETEAWLAHDGRLGCEGPRPTADGEPRRHPL